MPRDRASESEALRYFVTAYNRSNNDQLQFIALLEPGPPPPEPDAWCLLNGKELGVEVAHLYGTGQDAERLTKPDQQHRRNPLTEEERILNRIKPFRKRVLAPLNDILRDKAEKQYRRSPVWLLVRNMFPLWLVQDFEQHKDEIAVPEYSPFQHIWLLGEHDGGLLRLR